MDSTDDEGRKPTRASVTTVACTCDYLERASDKPDVPIVFDVEMNEYHIVHVGSTRGRMMIYHCPWCGGTAPKSKRGSFFATIPFAEATRLGQLTSGLATLDAVIQKFGKPDDDLAHGATIMTKPTTTTPSQFTSFRVLRYTALSETANVEFTDYGPHGVRASYRGKYLGRPKP
jgi:hypothetical protein